MALRPSVPALFARKPRCLEEIERFSQFAHYTGKMLLNGLIPGRLYDQFMLFSVALAILVSPALAKKDNLYAEELLNGSDFLVYNIHLLVHLACDAYHFGSLDECSVFRFECYLHQFKSLVRSGRSPVSQIVRLPGEMDRQVKETPKLATPVEKTAYAILLENLTNTVETVPLIWLEKTQEVLTFDSVLCWGSQSLIILNYNLF